MSKKVTIEMSMDEMHEERDVEIMIRANDLLMALHEVDQRLFRPAFKHGYPDIEEKLYTDLPKDRNDNDILDLLRKKYWEILEEYGINLDKLVY